MSDGWEKTFDAVVVGGGGSGLAAAASAAENGACVLLLEKQPQLGGSTGLAVGSYTTSESSHQKKAGVTDRAEDHVVDAGKFAPSEIEARNNADLRRFFLENSTETLEWLTGMGLVFHGPTPEPPNRAPRMHNVVPGARAYVLALESRLRKHGGTILCDVPVTKIIFEDSCVVGVEARNNGNLVRYRASKGVVLAAGDYSCAPDLIAKYKGSEFADIDGINRTAHGDGHRLCEDAGIPLVNMDVTYGPEIRFVPPEKLSLLKRLPAGGIVRALLGMLMPLTPKFVMDAIIKRELVTWQHPENSLFLDGAILVNSKGERFCNEKESPGREIALAKQPGKVAFILLDERLIELYGAWPHFVSTAPEIAYAYVEDYLRLRPDVSHQGDSLHSLAREANLPADRLSETVDAFNLHVSQGEPDPWGRPGDRETLSGNRWVLLGPAKSYFTTTEGSPAVDRDCQVLDGKGEPISGLYAVGQNGMGGQVLWGHGLHIAWAITSGRLVGKALARFEAPGPASCQETA